MKKILQFILLLSALQLNAQCDFVDYASVSGDTLHCNGGDNFRTAVAYHPGFNLYYSVNAGGITPEEVFDEYGTKVQGVAGPDWRGLWYNPNLGTIEGNGWNYGFAADSLQSNGYIGGKITTPGFVSKAPYNQAPGVFDTTANIIWYYYDGVLSGINRNDGTSVSSVNLTGFDKTKTLRTALIYTGCSGKEIGLYENSKAMVILFSKTSGQAVDSIQLPNGTPTGIYLDGQFAYANSILWIYNSNIMKWVGFDLFSSLSIDEKTVSSLNIYPNPSANGMFNIGDLDNTTSVVKVFNQIGEEVYSNVFNESKQQLNLSHLATGVYVVQATTENMIKREVVVIQ